MGRIYTVKVYEENLIVEITHEYAQSIVEKTKNLLGKNINIMNSLGIIVGSKDKSRIDTFHEGAAEVIKTGKEIEITSKQASELEGVKPGVNLPIYLNDNIVGVVGITGEPDEVRPYGQLLKISVEAMLKQFFLSEQLRMEQNAKELYVHDIINWNFEDTNVFLTKGEVLGYDLSLPRLALNIKVNNLVIKEKSKGLYDNQELTAQEKREKILDCIKKVFDNPQNMISHNGSNYYIVFFAPQKIHVKTVKQQIKEIADKLSKKLEKYSVKFCIGVGSYYPGLAGLRKSYKEAVKAIQIVERKSPGQLPQIIFAQDLSLEMMLAAAPDEIINIYKSQLLAKEGAKDFLSDEKLINTIKAFFSANLNISKSATKLNVTRNTVNARLDKIKTLTGLSPKDFNDAVKLMVLLKAIDVK
ncbi:sugar diacid recognition domain-containing protein [Tepidanaerobacter sp. GT38]|uniref:CdaR family transcriptional regulator n=1 Tax=Tepidanaerobacter sp. GT38 TaxID=2722793 RepID=UPI001F1B9F32|nr:sugar diacid recognition domain-containing protein [Tepidanaerobacter sp. GT38]